MSTEQMIKNILGAPATSRQVCTIVRALPADRYQVRDQLGRLSTVEPQAGQTWQPGRPVIVTGGRIIGGAGVAVRSGVTEV